MRIDGYQRLAPQVNGVVHRWAAHQNAEIPTSRWFLTPNIFRTCPCPPIPHPAGADDAR
jgi:hypothetical protein